LTVASGDVSNLETYPAFLNFAGVFYDKASKMAHYAMENNLTLKQAALKLGFVTEEEFDRVVDPTKMVQPYIAKAS
jgi:fumarate hydratase class II